MESNCCCAPKPCPNCGYCPCCGRGYGFIPYQPFQPWYPQPYPQPIWMVTPTTTTGIMHSTPNVTVTYGGVTY